MKKSLEAIIRPMTRTDFLSHFLSNTPVVSHGQLDDFNELTKLPFFNSLESLFKSWPTLLTAYRPGIADEGNSQKVSSTEAKEFFNLGSGLCFDDAHDFEPMLRDWLEVLKADLGFSELTNSRSLIYAIKKGRGTDPHFDQNINFVIQISRTKKWRVASNEHVANPMSRHTMGIDIEPELASYAKSEMPSSFPDNATEYLLQPGSVLFVPRGTWHITEAASDAVSLNFTFTAPTWIDILTTALRGHLAQDIPHWRAKDILEVTEYVGHE